MNKIDKPVQYKRGYCEFYKLKFFLTQDVLIPRPETELLVDEVLHVARSMWLEKFSTSHAPQTTHILDIGTGSGCIAISIAKNLANAKIIAVDISEKVLKVAEKNAKFHKVESKILFLHSDLLSFVISNPALRGERSQDLNLEILFESEPEGSFPQSRRLRSTQNDRVKIPDIIVANLPYIPTSKLMLIDPMVRDFEPKIALDGGRDGFEIYRRLFAQMKEKNFFPKYLIGEIDEDQGELALQEAKKLFPDAKIEIKKDLAKKDRVLIIRF